MKYLLMIYHDEAEWSGLTEKERENIYAEYRDLVGELQSSGKYLAGEELQPIDTASSVRMREGKQIITDGPFAETREQVGGFFLVEVNDRDEAVRIAAQIPSARTGTIEIRPVA